MKLFIAVLLCAAALPLALTAAEAKTKRDPFHLRLPRAADDIPDATVGKRQTCEPYSDEYEERIYALFCQRNILRAFEAEIKGSNCKNIFYSELYDDEDNCDGPRDERENVRNCSDTCSSRVFYYVYCTTVGEQYAEISRECGDPLDGAGVCSFFNGDFCFFQYNSTSDLIDECSSTDSRGGVIECSEKCRDAVETYVEDIGCCVAYWKNEYIGDYDKTTSDIFSACGVNVPSACTSFSPPKEFLDCSHDSAAERLGPASLPVMISATIALIIAGVQ